VENVAHNMVAGTGFPVAPRFPAPLKDSAGAHLGTVVGYTGLAPLDLSAGKRKIMVEDKAKRLADGRFLYSGGFNHRAANCAARKKALMFKAGGAEVKEITTRTGSEDSGND